VTIDTAGSLSITGGDAAAVDVDDAVADDLRAELDERLRTALAARRQGRHDRRDRRARALAAVDAPGVDTRDPDGRSSTPGADPADARTDEPPEPRTGDTDGHADADGFVWDVSFDAPEANGVDRTAPGRAGGSVGTQGETDDADADTPGVHDADAGDSSDVRTRDADDEHGSAADGDEDGDGEGDEDGDGNGSAVAGDGDDRSEGADPDDGDANRRGEGDR
jgi:putative membrane protein